MLPSHGWIIVKQTETEKEDEVDWKQQVSWPQKGVKTKVALRDKGQEEKEEEGKEMRSKVLLRIEEQEDGEGKNCSTVQMRLAGATLDSCWELTWEKIKCCKCREYHGRPPGQRYIGTFFAEESITFNWRKESLTFPALLVKSTDTCQPSPSHSVSQTNIFLLLFLSLNLLLAFSLFS